ncbi:MAG: hypothetical protein J6Y28_07930 [Acholeplasmatales bacterium]|nr:hypothetical protein [Acholeplasmatales bacterium]
MTEETKTIISNIIAGVDITPENLLIAKKALDEKLIKDKEAVNKIKEYQAADETLLANIESKMSEYIKENGEIQFDLDGKTKEYYLRDKEKVTISKDEEYQDYLKDNFPTLFVPSYTFLEKDLKEAIKNGSITDARALSGVTTTVTQELATRSIKKSKKTTTVVEEGGDE